MAAGRILQGNRTAIFREKQPGELFGKGAKTKKPWRKLKNELKTIPGTLVRKFDRGGSLQCARGPKRADEGVISLDGPAGLGEMIAEQLLPALSGAGQRGLARSIETNVKKEGNQCEGETC